MKEGQAIKDGLQYSNSSSLHAKADWERRVDQYLMMNLDESYAIRFRSPSHQVNSYPVGMSTQMLSPEQRWLQKWQCSMISLLSFGTKRAEKATG